MSRRSLRPQLNQIRGWVRQGRTDAWIAHQLEVTVQQIQSFKRENELEADGETAGEPIEEVDLRAEDDAAIAAELEAEAARRAEEEAKLAEEAAKRAADEPAEPTTTPTRSPRRASAPAEARKPAAGKTPRGRSRGPSTTARRATGCGSTPPSRTTRPTRSTGRATGPSRSRSRRTRSSSAAPVAATATELARLRAHRRALFERTASRAEPFEHGTAYFTPEHPTKWDLNLLVVDDGAGLTAEGLLADAERLQAPAGLRHRKVEVHTGADALVKGFKAAGWSAERVVVMLLRPGADQRGEAPAPVREVEFPAVRGLMEQWYGEAMSATEARDLADADADSARVSGARFFLTERDGDPAACCMLLAGDGIGQVEEVYTAQAAPRRGPRQRGRPHRDRRGPGARRRPDHDHGRRRRLAPAALRAAGVRDGRRVPDVHAQARLA